MPKVSLPPPPTTAEIEGRVWTTWFSKLFSRVGEGPLMVRGYTVSTLPTASEWGSTGSDPFSSVIFVSDESGGATLAFSDGTNWRRVKDLAVVS